MGSSFVIKMKKYFLFTALVTMVLPSYTQQQVIHPDYSSLENFRTVNREISLAGTGNKLIAHINSKEGMGTAWIKGIQLENGIIELDIKGKNVMQQSFVGIAFHRVNDSTYDAIYFRPFNFNSTDSIRKNHAVQYISLPTFDWPYLRQNSPDKYENKLTSSIDPNNWFHAKIVIKPEKIEAFINNDKVPSLIVKPLHDYKNGEIGFWVGNFSDGDFSNLIITK